MKYSIDKKIASIIFGHILTNQAIVQALRILKQKFSEKAHEIVYKKHKLITKHSLVQIGFISKDLKKVSSQNLITKPYNSNLYVKTFLSNKKKNSKFPIDQQFMYLASNPNLIKTIFKAAHIVFKFFIFCLFLSEITMVLPNDKNSDQYQGSG